MNIIDILSKYSCFLWYTSHDFNNYLVFMKKCYLMLWWTLPIGEWWPQGLLTYYVLYTAHSSCCTSYSYIKPLTLVYYILCSGDLHFIQLKLYIAIIIIDLISLISKIHILLKVLISQYTMGNRCIFFVYVDYFASSVSRPSNVLYDWLIELCDLGNFTLIGSWTCLILVQSSLLLH